MYYVKIGEFVKMLELRHKIGGENPLKEKIWSKLEIIRQKHLEVSKAKKKIIVRKSKPGSKTKKKMGEIE